MPNYLRRSGVFLIASLLAGCGGNTIGSPKPSFLTNLTGNWFFTTLYPGNVPQNVVYVGALTQQGNSITAILHNPCYFGDIDLSGTEDTSGNLILTSSNLPGNALTIQGTVLSSGEVVETSNYTFTVTGSGPCALAATTLSGSQVPTFSGNFTGSLNSTMGATANFTVNMNQKSANADGEFPLSGTITVGSSSCTVTFPLSILFAGDSVTANLTSATGPASTAVFSAGPVIIGGTASTLTNVNIAIAGCNAGTFTGSLSE